MLSLLQNTPSNTS